MSKYLVVVESPAKAKTIKKFLGKNYKIKASMGHIRDLPKSSLGVDIENNFEPKYINIRGKGSIISELKKEAKEADKIFLATDPDREGEAISWHLSDIFNLPADEKCRITFNEITKNAVTKAVKSPRPIDMNLVDAQQARRVLDRIVGYEISPILWRNVRKGLSAGRVQSAAMKMICDREREIDQFVPEEYWHIDGLFQKENGKTFKARFYGLKDKKIELSSEEEVKIILQELEGVGYVIGKVKHGEKKRAPLPPFTTSTLQQEASRKLGFSTKKTMMLAQQLYEGVEIEGEGSVGLITYMRTDSTRISDEALSEARKYILDKYGQEYLPGKPRIYKTKSTSQDAHEAIRPTTLDIPLETVKSSLPRDLFRLYKLIWERFISSQMESALYDTMAVDIEAGRYLFKAKGSRIKFNGYLVLYEESSDESTESNPEEEESLLPELIEGENVKVLEIIHSQHFTQPPSRYTEAMLVKAMEEKGIGRPSTYAPIISTILTRGYVVKDKKFLVPTELGKIVNDLLENHFKDIVNINFTAEMEAKLDSIEEGKLGWRELMNEFYKDFSNTVKEAEKKIEKVRLPVEESDEVCEKCGRKMVIKTGKYGKFLACPGFPECRNAKPIFEDAGVTCPKCGGKVLIKKTRKGKNYLGCENYPECDYSSWDMHSDKKCPKCGNFMTKKYRGGKVVYTCSLESCSHTIEETRKKQEDLN
ncbi:MAG: type I DNA topoisomerase [Clostridiaceae bacterium]|nr:type I DNA topoisomerase [Clostridiaceae bacterium]